MRYLDMYPVFTIAPEHREAFAKTRSGAVAGQRLVDRFGWKLGQKLPISSEIHPKADGNLHWDSTWSASSLAMPAAGLGRILAAVFFTILLLTGNTMAQSIRERGVIVGQEGGPAVCRVERVRGSASGTAPGPCGATGFGGVPVVVSVMMEALLLALLGGAVGGALAYVYCDGASLPTLNFIMFSQVAFDFRVRPRLLGQGLVWALVIGTVGGLLPAIRAARLPVTLALRIS